MTEYEKQLEEENDRAWEEYFIPGTNVLKNNLGVTEEQELKQLDAECSFKRLVELYENPIKGTFDAEHLKAIHRYIFRDIYPFAGEFRNVGMRKTEIFTDPQDIPRKLDVAISEMYEDFSNSHNRSEYVHFLSYTYTALLRIHPFREGNGRAIREFIREFVEEKMPDYTIKWSLVDGPQLEKGILNAYLSLTMVETEFEKALVPKDPEKKLI